MNSQISSEQLVMDISSLYDLPLISVELEALKRFKELPESRAFLAVAEICLKYQKRELALQVFSYGLSLHPSYSVARVRYARELFEQGQVDAAWQLLKQARLSLRDNRSAQALCFKIAFVLGDYELVEKALEELQELGHVEHDIRFWVERMTTESMSELRFEFVDSLISQGYDLHHYKVGPQRRLGESSVSSDHKPLEDESLDKLRGFKILTMTEIRKALLRSGKSLEPTMEGISLPSTARSDRQTVLEDDLTRSQVAYLQSLLDQLERQSGG